MEPTILVLAFLTKLLVRIFPFVSLQQSVQQQLRPQASQSQQQPGIYSSQDVYQPLLMKASVTEMASDSPGGVRTYCQGSHKLDSDESMV